MTISFRCEHCRKKVEAPDQAGGRRGRCPYCKGECYVPKPVADDELLPLAEEDPAAEAQHQQELARLAEAQRALRKDLDSEPAAPLEHREDLKAEDLYHLVVNYCLALADSKLPQAEAHAKELHKHRHLAMTAVDDFVTGRTVEAALQRIPGKLLQGFLMQLMVRMKA